MTMHDEHAEWVDVFLGKGFAPPIPGKPVPQSAFDRYSGVLPDALLRIWAEFGWAGFGDGRLWLTDPTEWASIFEEWFHDVELPIQDDFHIILRDAFGNFECWGQQSGLSLSVNVVHTELVIDKGEAAEIVAHGPDLTLLTRLSVYRPQTLETYREDNGGPLFAAARNVHGQLSYDEVYGFFPPVSLSGAPEHSDLHRVGAIPHLAILAQSAPAEFHVRTFGSVTFT